MRHGCHTDQIIELGKEDAVMKPLENALAERTVAISWECFRVPLDAPEGFLDRLT
jgi:hypothetical protein